MSVFNRCQRLVFNSFLWLFLYSFQKLSCYSLAINPPYLGFNREEEDTEEDREDPNAGEKEEAERYRETMERDMAGSQVPEKENDHDRRREEEMKIEADLRMRQMVCSWGDGRGRARASGRERERQREREKEKERERELTSL